MQVGWSVTLNLNNIRESWMLNTPKKKREGENTPPPPTKKKIQDPMLG